MKSKIIQLFIAVLLVADGFSQRAIFELTFTAVDCTSYVKVDSIKVMNRTQGVDTVLFYPDTVLVLDDHVGIFENKQEKQGLQVFQNYPNPVKDKTCISLYIQEKDDVDLTVTNLFGQQIIHNTIKLDKGYHSFLFTPGDAVVYFFTAQANGNSSGIKILHSPSGSFCKSSLEYIGDDKSTRKLKTTNDEQSFSFSIGDELLYIGYADSIQSGFLDRPETSEEYTFQFATNIPCPGTPTVTYEGQTYNTIQIVSQCWLKENLNVGAMINSNQNMQNNGLAEKYCYDDIPEKCNQYGALYQWGEMMKYTYSQWAQGLCPQDWHIPTEEEWKVLEGSADSQYGIGDPLWDQYGYRGFDAGLNLRTTYGWASGNNGTDLLGFSALPGGYGSSGSFDYAGYYGYWWTSTQEDTYVTWAWHHELQLSYSGGIHYIMIKSDALSVRCLRDY
jgi:uncharacterized protein (TIGR02145 family)